MKVLVFKFAKNDINHKKKYHRQSFEVLFKELGQKKMPNPPSHMEKEGESNV
jgi:hypothetical protein